MSDIDPDLPDYLVDALLSQQPPPDAVDLVKNSFTWRTIEAELMEISYDSVLDTAGVRDAGATRTLEFAAGEIALVVEVVASAVRGQVVPADSASAVRLLGQSDLSSSVDSVGAFSFDEVPAGTYRLELTAGDEVLSSPAFTVA